MRLKTCFRSETFPGIDIKWFAADRANAVSFVKTQNVQTLFSSSAFSNTSFCGGARGGKIPRHKHFFRVKMEPFKRASRCARWIDVIFETRVLSRVLLFFDFFPSFWWKFFVLSGKMFFLLFSEECKKQHQSELWEFDHADGVYANRSRWSSLHEWNTLDALFRLSIVEVSRRLHQH